MTAEGFDFLFTRWPVISKWQVLWACMAGYTWYCTALTQGGSVILQQTPKHRCKTALDDTIEGFSFEDGLEFSPSSCEKYPDSWTAQCLHGENLSACFNRQSANLTTVECDSGFIYDDELFESTFVTEFDLVCERSYVNTVSTSIFMSGLFVSVSIFGPIMDRFGRRKGMLFGLIGLMIANVIISISNSVAMFTLGRFLAGAFAMGAATCCFVYAVELPGARWRTWFGQAVNNCCSLGFLTLSFIGYFFKDWQSQSLAIAVFPLPFVLFFFWVLPVSSPWLFSTGNYEKASENILEIGVKYFPDRQIDYEFTEKLTAQIKLKQSDEKSAQVRTQLDILRPPGMRKITMIELYQWFATTLVFYGLAFGAGNLSGSLLQNNAYNALVEILAQTVTPFLVDRKIIGRRYGTIITMSIGFLACFGAAACDVLEMENAKRVLAIIGKFGVTGTFACIYIHTSELFPTEVRGIGVGFASAGGRIGGIFAPLVLQFGNKLSWLPFFIFGCFGLVQVITCFLLPETLGQEMLGSIEEAEEFYRNPKMHGKRNYSLAKLQDE
ncbi:Oidioi.mRNA.OKI2018_I69.chr1.g2750.t1.cds [Oikopleura dioica]|uniref:Oidioi.mRNA.OKI2018_I69.chr1.g2750.t1.cds n=1 Tax=Oikopleura dioica TaxID=34765 RepID=A0ABN7SS13_OIKDI|nr:Oidioi.mRNA.OKI2018_I69.chr1.g2750.t1.cds [Oikopleura dioica]